MPWIIITVIGAGVVFGLDCLLRRKRWKNNTTAEKISLIVNMLTVGPYVFFSLLSVLWGIAAIPPETAFGEIVYDVTLKIGQFYFIVAAAAVILSFVFRVIKKAKASIWTNVIASLYLVAVLGINTLAGKFL